MVVSPAAFELQPGLTFVAPDGPYKDRLMTLKRVDNTKPDRWIVESDDGKEWAAPGVRLREVLAQQAKEVRVPQEAPPAGPAVPEAAPIQANAAPPGPAAPAAPERASSEPAPPPAQEAPAPGVSSAEQPAPAALDFAHTPVKIVIQLWADEGEGRTAWIGGDLPDRNPLSATLSAEQVTEVLHLFAGLLDQLEAEFPARQAKIVAALAADSRTSYVPPARTTSAPATRPKPAGRTPKGTLLTTVPAGADQPKPTPGPSPERQAYLATIQQPDMFATVPQATPAPAAPSEAH